MEQCKQAKQKIKKRLTKAFFGDDVGGKIGSGILHQMNTLFGLHSISALLPFQFYDFDAQIYHMQHAKGILLKSSPMTGASNDNAEAIYNLLQRILPEGSIVQIMLYASPYVGEALDSYAALRQSHVDILEKNAEYRIKFLKQGAYQSLVNGQNYVLRDFQSYISIVFDNKMELSVSEIHAYSQRVIGVLEGIKVYATSVLPEGFLQLVDALLRPKGSVYPKEYHYDELRTLSEQLASPEESHKVTSQRIIVNEGDWEIRSFRVADFPKTPVHLYEMGDLIGSMFDNNAKIGCPFMISLTIYISDQSRFKDIGHYRGYRARQRAKQLGMDSPKAGDDASEAINILKQLEDNEKVVLGDFQVFLYCRPSDAHTHETALENVFQAPAKKWRLIKNTMLHMVSLLSHLPLAQSHQHFQDLQNLGLTHKLWSMNAANMVPLLAEMKGGDSRRLLFMQRQGQILFWDPFNNEHGNYNTSIAGSSGSGKSVTAQEVAASLIGTGARIWVIDVGRSYKKLCHLAGGQFIEFTKAANLCLNPFSTVNPEELDEFFSFMVPLVAKMSDPDGHCSSLERSMIEQAVKAVWHQKKQSGGLSDIANWLLHHKDGRARDIGVTLYSYTEQGQYSGYFNGEANVNFDNKMVVFELEEINSNKRLQGIIFMLLMYHVTEKMYLGARTTRMALIIDEAWDMLKGGYGGEIIESIARRARKYQGALITITQSVSDFFSSPAGMAAYNNSYWRILHQQAQENISTLIDDKKLILSPYQERLLRSLNTEHGKYSEVMLLGGSGECAVLRLILDPYSRILYSTKGNEFAAVEKLCQQGMPMAEAIAVVTEQVFGENIWSI